LENHKNTPVGGASPDGSTIDARMTTGAVWMVLARMTDRALALVSTVILARLLVPADFGLVAMATALIAMLELMATFGFDIALIRHPAPARSHFDTAWTCNVIFGVLVAASMLALAIPAAWFYAEPRLSTIVVCLALGVFVQGFENIGVVEFRRQMRFDREFLLLFAKRTVSFAATIPLAFLLRNYWALVFGTIISRVSSAILTYVFHGYRPRFSLAARAELVGFGKWLVFSSVLSFMGTRAADFLLGRISGARQLGLFSVSYEFALLPSSDFVAPINRAVFPAYARKAAEPGELKRSYLDVLGLIAVVAVPAGAGIAAVAELLVQVVLGPNWMGASPVISVLAINAILQALKSNAHFVYLALGRPQLATFLGTVHIALLLPAIVVGAHLQDALGAAVGYVVAQALFTPVSVTVLKRALGLKFIELFAVVHRPVLAAAAMYGAVRALVALVGADHQGGVVPVLMLFVCVLSGVAFYCAALCVLWVLEGKPRGAETRAVSFVRQKLRALVGSLRLTTSRGAGS
jgi:lipopolysaccharide exporter